MGIRGIYIAGSPMINAPWGADGYSPLDLTLLDPHLGTVRQWQDLITDMHSRGMYVIVDNTMATMGDLIGFEGYLNLSTPLSYTEHNAVWKDSRRYHDFNFGNVELNECDYPRFWGSVSKFASVQDRLREWRPSVRQKIEHLNCLQITMLDIDGFRMDKGLQITADAEGEWGKEPSMADASTFQSVMTTENTSDPSKYIREKGKTGFDSAAFHYSIYRSLKRFLGYDKRFPKKI
ncbi:MAG: hypothetical protein Q9170_005506 [Blastenia crenularia]